MFILARPDGRHETPSYIMEQLASDRQVIGSSDDVAQTPAIKLRIKIGHETVVGTKRFAD